MLVEAKEATAVKRLLSDGDSRRSENLFSRWRNHTSSWRFGIIAGAVSSFIIFLLNTSITIWASSHHGINAGQGTVFLGSCSTMKRLNLFIHLMINIFGTVLLGASNYCMQCLSAPTRREVDKAHARMIWLDIGVPSLRNLFHIDSRRTLLLFCVALTSLPLHLFYNSALYSSFSANQYQALVVRNDLLSDASNHNYPVLDHARAGVLQKLSFGECIRAYSPAYQNSYGNVVLVVNETWYKDNRDDISKNHLDLYIPYSFDASVNSTGCEQSSWVCQEAPPGNSTCVSGCSQRTNELVRQSGWMVYGWIIDHCYSEYTQEHCTINFSLHIAIIVIVMNAVKVALFTFIAFTNKEPPLLNMGDAVSSFIREPDPTTHGMCLMSRSDFEKEDDPWLSGTGPRFFYEEPKRWSKAASKKRWVTVFLLFGMATSICLFYALYAVAQLNNFGSFWKLGFGTIDPETLIRWRLPTHGASGIIANTLAANVPQVVLSLVYVNFNAVLTCLFLAHEWNQYGHTRKGLRVSSVPKGAQRMTYFLQLPYRYGVPLLCISSFLHWLISQSVYLVSIKTYTPGDPMQSPTNGNKTAFAVQHDSTHDILTCGYSPIGILAVVLTGLVALFLLIFLGKRRFPPGIPLAGSCSAAIAAACHVTDNEPLDAAELKLKWGVVRNASGGVGHCGFSSLEVERPEAHKLYAGLLLSE